MTTTYRNIEITIEPIKTPHGTLYRVTKPQPSECAWGTSLEALTEEQRRIDQQLKPITLPELCFHLDPSQQATLYAMIKTNAEEISDPEEYTRIMQAIKEEMHANCGPEDTEFYIARALA